MLVSWLTENLGLSSLLLLNWVLVIEPF
jgi:hypothetical protein